MKDLRTLRDIIFSQTGSENDELEKEFDDPTWLSFLTDLTFSLLAQITNVPSNTLRRCEQGSRVIHVLAMWFRCVNISVSCDPITSLMRAFLYCHKSPRSSRFSCVKMIQLEDDVDPDS